MRAFSLWLVDLDHGQLPEGVTLVLWPKGNVPTTVKPLRIANSGLF
jgi:hypothetical protein